MTSDVWGEDGGLWWEKGGRPRVWSPRLSPGADIQWLRALGWEARVPNRPAYRANNQKSPQIMAKYRQGDMRRKPRTEKANIFQLDYNNSVGISRADCNTRIAWETLPYTLHVFISLRTKSTTSTKMYILFSKCEKDRLEWLWLKNALASEGLSVSTHTLEPSSPRGDSDLLEEETLRGRQCFCFSWGQPGLQLTKPPFCELAQRG